MSVWSLLIIKEPTNRNESEQVVNKGKMAPPQDLSEDFDLYRKNQQARLYIMKIWVEEFSNGGYKIRKVFA